MNRFWEEPAQVARFAEREADHRLMALLPALTERAPRARVLDLGCAGGRNTALLAAMGFDLHARDASAAMVARTRTRVAAVLGDAEAERRVRTGRMDDLAEFGAAVFDLVVALGIFHCAESLAEWERAVAETARVLADGGLALVAHFAPGTDPTGRGLTPVPDQPHIFRGFESALHTLMAADELDAGMARHGLLPAEPTQTVERATDSGRRVTVNGLYRKP